MLPLSGTSNSWIINFKNLVRSGYGSEEFRVRLFLDQKNPDNTNWSKPPHACLTTLQRLTSKAHGQFARQQWQRRCQFRTAICVDTPYEPVLLDQNLCGGETALSLVKGTSLFFSRSVLSFSPSYVSTIIWRTASYTFPPAPFAYLLHSLFSWNTCRPGREGGLLPFGQQRQSLFASDYCAAEQTALLLHCGQSLGPSLWQMPPSRNR